MAQRFGHIYHWKLRGLWIVDVRPYGKIFEIPMGDGGLRLDREELAQAVLDSIRNRIAEGMTKEAACAPYLPRSRASLGPKLEAWLAVMRRRVTAGERSPNYLRELERYAKPGGYFSFLSEYSIHELNYGVLEDWIGSLTDRGIGAKTRSNAVGALSSFCGWLHKRGELERLPRFPETPFRRHAPKTISVDAQELVLDQIPENRRGAFIAAVELLIRPGEVRALNVSDYSFRTRQLTISAAMKGPTSNAPRRGTKEDDLRVREVPDRLADWLEEDIPPRERLDGSRPLFVNPTARTKGKRWIANALREEWKRAAKRPGLGDVRMYEGTKHSTATALRRAGVPLDVIQAACGHKDPRSTELYARLADSAVVEALRKRRSV
jgi:integrase